MARKFKAGDWVEIRGKQDSPKMEVLKYVPKKEPIFGFFDNDTFLECVWYRNGERKSRIFHQNRLLKLKDSGDIHQT
nr:hypothetical protein [uncultured Allomuricauda sp.]